MSQWDTLGIESKIKGILREVPDAMEEHHFGPPFLSAYQIAIEYAKRHPQHLKQLGGEIGGAGIGQRTSLAQYIARQLSRLIKSGELKDVIQGAFLSNQRLDDISFDKGGEIIHSSLTDSGFTLSMFRLVRK